MAAISVQYRGGCTISNQFYNGLLALSSAAVGSASHPCGFGFVLL